MWWAFSLSFLTTALASNNQSEQVALLQIPTRSVFDGISPQGDAIKFRWLHVPKTGSSFGNVLVTQACPQLPGNRQYQADFTSKLGSEGLAMYVCRADFDLPGGHQVISDEADDDFGWNEHKGNFVTMLRRPAQRVISGFNHEMHGYKGPKNATASDYAKVVSGCTVKMMNGYLCGNTDYRQKNVQNNVLEAKPTKDMLDNAKRRLDEGFAFVGITDDWELSVCLFHAMFGGTCHAREFYNSRRGKNRELIGSTDMSSYNATDLLSGFVDEYDGALYIHARMLFAKALKTHHVDPNTCARKICPSTSEQFEHLATGF